MGKGILMAFMLLLPFICLSQEAEMTFPEVDGKTYALYSEGKWKDLIRAGNEALKNGFDYYYLRIRIGIAYFERRNYVQAARHFEEALKLNAGDPLAGEYLYGCYLEMNRPADGYKILKQLPVSIQDRLKKSAPKLHSADISGGLIFSDQPDKFDHFDLDGDSSYYGEVDMIRSGTDINAGVSWGFENGIKLYGGYTWIRLDKNKLVSIGDTMAVDDQYVLNQHQCYLNGTIPLWKGFSVKAAVNYLLDDYEVVMPQYDSAFNSYDFPVESNRLQSVIGYLSVTKDFKIVQTSLFGAWSNLNDREQIQAGFHLMAFPFGNLDCYLSSKVMDHIVDADHHFIFEQMIGGRIIKPLWAEVNATFGEMVDYHENSAYVVYNFADKMDFKGGGKLIWTMGPRTTLTMEYILLKRMGNYIVYSNIGTNGKIDVVPVTMTESFYNHIIVAGINWKF